MRTLRMHTSRLLLLLCTLLIVTMTGCGKKEPGELETYRNNMTSFFDVVKAYNDSINTIDSLSPDAPANLLANIDGLNAAFQQMLNYPIPKEFSAMESISAEAADYMNLAAKSYHDAYDGEFNTEALNLADQYYERANTRLFLMVELLRGETPSGEGITVTTEESYNLATIPDDVQADEAMTDEFAQTEETTESVQADPAADQTGNADAPAAPAATESTPAKTETTAPAKTETAASTAPAKTETAASTAPAKTETSASTAPAKTETAATTAPASETPKQEEVKQEETKQEEPKQETTAPQSSGSSAGTVSGSSAGNI